MASTETVTPKPPSPTWAYMPPGWATSGWRNPTSFSGALGRQAPQISTASRDQPFRQYQFWSLGQPAPQVGQPTAYARDLTTAISRLGNLPMIPQANQFRSGQASLANMLYRQALTGETPEVRSIQEDLNRAIGQQIGFSRAMGGPNAAMAARLASQNIGNLEQAGASQMSQARLAARLGAMGQLGDVLGQGRGMDINVAAQNLQNMLAGLGQAGQLMSGARALQAEQMRANLAAQLQQRGLAGEIAAQARMGDLGLSQANLGARMQQQALNADLMARLMAVDLQRAQMIQEGALAREQALTAREVARLGGQAQINAIREQKPELWQTILGGLGGLAGGLFGLFG